MSQLEDPRQSERVAIIMEAMNLDTDLLANPDIQYHRQRIDQYLAGWGLEIDPDKSNIHGGINIYDQLDRAEKLAGVERMYAVFLAYRKAQSFYFGMWKKIKGHKKPMSEKTKQILRERKESAREAKGTPPRRKVASKGRTPIYMDKTAQKQKEKQYPWAVPGSWRKDPDKESGTLLEISCLDCKDERTVHAADLFQTKRCTKCQKAKH